MIPRNRLMRLILFMGQVSCGQKYQLYKIFFTPYNFLFQLLLNCQTKCDLGPGSIEMLINY